MGPMNMVTERQMSRHRGDAGVGAAVVLGVGDGGGQGVDLHM